MICPVVIWESIPGRGNSKGEGQAGSRGIFDLFEEQENQRSFSRVRREGKSVDESRGPREQVASTGYSSE